MNIVKMQEMLKGVPENALIGYVQNPGQVPSYLALGELQRRKKMREEAATQAQAPQQSVAEQMVEQAQPAPMDMGVASLPVENVGNEEAFAHGGIVGYADGGDIASAQAQALAQINSYRIQNGLAPLTLEDMAPGQAPSRRVDGVYESPYMPKEAPWLTDWKRTVPNLWSPTDIKFKQPTEPQKASEKTKKEVAEAAAPAATTPPAAAPTAKKPAAGGKEPSGIATARAMNDEIAKQKAGQAAPAQATGLASLKYNAIPEDVSGFDAGLMQDLSAEDAAARYRTMIGEDPARAGMQERLAKLEGRAAETERLAPWQALTKAGLAIAGGESPFWVQNVGKGAMVGVEDYAKSRDKMQELEEKRFDMAQKLAAAERAETIAAATYGLEDERTRKAHNARINAEKQAAKLDIRVRNAAGQLEAAKGNLAADIDLRKMAQQREIAEMESRDRRAQTAATRAGYARLSDYETYLEGAKQDPANYKVVKGADGKDQRIFDIQKVNKQYRQDAAYGTTYGADLRAEMAKEDKYNKWAGDNPGKVLKLENEGKDPRAYWESNVFKGGAGAGSGTQGFEYLGVSK